MKTKIICFLISIIFLTSGVIFIKRYGISWDEPVHFRRGQAYLHYFLTGRLDYQDLMPYDLVKAQNNVGYHARSIYQSDDFVWGKGVNPVIKDSGHPPLADIAASAFNLIFFQKLGILGDVESYHLFIILLSAILVAVTYQVVSGIYGKGAGLSAALFLATYPLFWAESHFNIKDPPETVFFGISILFFWLGINRQKLRFLYLSAVVAGLALSVKFNALFLIPIYVIWLTLIHFKDKLAFRKIISTKGVWLSLLLFVPIMFAVLFASWPYLWGNPARIIEVFRYYSDIGTATHFQNNFVLGPINFYPVVWILLTTTPFLLLSFFVGLVTRFLKQNRSSGINFLDLVLVWFLIPVLRVSFSKFSIYGGIRQIMEYIPAMAIIAGIGFTFILKKLKPPLKLILSLVGIVAVLFPLVKLFPNENVYFNFLAGGVSGAIKKEVPAAGNTFGNVYKQGVDWLNQNAPLGSKLTLIQGTTSNLVLYQLRPDIGYANTNWSGIERGGEYVMEMTYNAEVEAYHYAWEYVDKMLVPIYEIKADGAPLLKIWKNDLNHTISLYQKNEVVYQKAIPGGNKATVIYFNLGKSVTLSRLILTHGFNAICDNNESGFFDTSIDGINWVKEADPVGSTQIYRKIADNQNSLTFFLAARKAAYLRFTPSHLNACAYLNPVLEVRVLPNFPF